MDDIVIVFVSLYMNRNYNVRVLHPLVESIKGVKPYSVFLKNCEVNVFEYPTETELELFLSTIKDLKPSIVSFTVMSPYALTARKITRLVKQQNPDTIIIWGGIHPTIYPDGCIDDADIVCIGEGEGALTDLLTNIRDGNPYNSISNLWIRLGNTIIKNSLRPLIQDLDALPFPLYGSKSYYFIDNNKISQNDPLLEDPYYLIQTSRGCPWNCAYCGNSALKQVYRELGPYTRRKSVRTVIREIKQFLSSTKKNTRFIVFIDEVFAIEKQWLEDFVSQYKKEIKLPFLVEYHPKLLNINIIERLKDAGLDTIIMGIQAGSDYVRNQVYDRPGTNEEIVLLAQEISRRGIKISYDLILDSPYVKEKELKETINLLFQLPKPLIFALYSLQFFPNYPLTRKAINDGYLKKEDAGWEDLIEKTMKNWAYVPKLFPNTKEQKLKNIIWLIALNKTGDNTVKKAVFSDSFLSPLLLNYLHVKSVVLSKFYGDGRPRITLYAISALQYVKAGDFHMLFAKIKERCF